MLAIVSAFAASVAFADPQTYYVDERGSDDYDGKASYADIDTSVSPVKGPKKTLKAAAALVTATTSADQVGDTIYIYPGDYRNTESSPAFCAVLPAGCRLIGVGDKSAIRIHGSGMNWEDRATEAAASGTKRCLSLGSRTLVKGVTLRDGRADSDTRGGCCKSGTTDSFLVDCVLTENYTADRGGVLTGSGTIPIRCLFVKNGAPSYGGMYNGSCFNCVFDQTGGSGSAGYKTMMYNCTFISGANRSGGCLTNCLSKVNHVEVSAIGGTIIKSSLALESDYTLPAGSAAIDYGNNDSYLNAFPTSDLVADQKYLDFNGRRQ